MIGFALKAEILVRDVVWLAPPAVVQVTVPPKPPS